MYALKSLATRSLVRTATDRPRANVFDPKLLRAKFTSYRTSFGNKVGEEVGHSGALRRVIDWPGNAFTSLYGRPAMLLFKGLSAVGNNVLYGIKVLLLVAKEGKVRKRADIWHFVRLKRDMILATPYFFLIPGCFMLPVLPVVCKYAPMLVPTTFYTAQVLDFKLSNDTANRKLAYDPLTSQINVEFVRRSVQDPETQDRLLKLACTSDDRQSAAAELNSLAKAHNLPLEVIVWIQLLLSRLSSAEGGHVSYTSYDMVAKLLPLFLGKSGVQPFCLFNVRKLSVLAGKAIGIRFPGMLPQTRLLIWADWMLKDDALVRSEGVSSLTHYELLEALSMRGYVGLSTTVKISVLQQLLTSHIKFTQNLSRQLLLQQNFSERQSSAGEKGLGSIVSTKSSDEKYGHLLDPLQVSAVGSMVLLARILDVTR